MLHGHRRFGSKSADRAIAHVTASTEIPYLKHDSFMLFWARVCMYGQNFKITWAEKELKKYKTTKCSTMLQGYATSNKTNKSNLQPRSTAAEVELTSYRQVLQAVVRSARAPLWSRGPSMSPLVVALCCDMLLPLCKKNSGGSMAMRGRRVG